MKRLTAISVLLTLACAAHSQSINTIKAIDSISSQIDSVKTYSGIWLKVAKGVGRFDLYLFLYNSASKTLHKVEYWERSNSKRKYTYYYNHDKLIKIDANVKNKDTILTGLYYFRNGVLIRKRSNEIKRNLQEMKEDAEFCLMRIHELVK